MEGDSPLRLRNHRISDRGRLRSNFEEPDLGWPIIAPVFALAFTLGLFNRAFLGWGRTAFAISLALSVPIIGYRRFWHWSRYWLTVAFLIVLHIPWIYLTRPLIEQSNLGMLAFGIIDALLSSVVVARVCGKQDS